MLATFYGAKAGRPVASIDKGWFLRSRGIEHEDLLADLLLGRAAIRGLLKDATVWFFLRILLIWCPHHLLSLLLQRIRG